MAWRYQGATLSPTTLSFAGPKGLTTTEHTNLSTQVPSAQATQTSSDQVNHSAHTTTTILPDATITMLPDATTTMLPGATTTMLPDTTTTTCQSKTMDHNTAQDPGTHAINRFKNLNNHNYEHSVLKCISFNYRSFNTGNDYLANLLSCNDILCLTEIWLRPGELVGKKLWLQNNPFLCKDEFVVFSTSAMNDVTHL